MYVYKSAVYDRSVVSRCHELGKKVANCVNLALVRDRAISGVVEARSTTRRISTDRHDTVTLMMCEVELDVVAYWQPLQLHYCSTKVARTSRAVVFWTRRLLTSTVLQ